MKIGELAKRSGASVRSIRHYEAMGLIRPTRTASGYRDFEPDDAALVSRIRRMIGLGFSTSEIALFLPQISGEAARASDCRAVTAAHRAKLDEVERQIADLERRRDALRATLREAVQPPCSDETGSASPVSMPLPSPSSSPRSRK